MSLKGLLMFAGDSIPQPDRVIPPSTSAGKRTSIWGECHGKHPICVSFKSVLMLSGGDVPQPNCVVITSTGKCAPVWGKR